LSFAALQDGVNLSAGIDSLGVAAVPESVGGVILGDWRPAKREAVLTGLGSVDGEGLGNALVHGLGLLEAADGRLLTGRHMRSILDRSGLYLVVKTNTAYSVEVANTVCNALAKRLNLRDEVRDNMELALHEALINGLIHGNLEISSTDRHTLARFAEYCESIENRLADQSWGSRPIEVFATWTPLTIDVSVVDCGRGYDHQSIGKSNDPARKSGRGLQLISTLAQDVEIGDGGRRLSMRFNR